MAEMPAADGVLERVFKLTDRNASLRGEVVGGVTTFMTMSYIIFLNAIILSAAGMPMGGVMVATCLGAAFACFLMGFMANLPVALAPGMGMNALVAYGICKTFSWQAALGMVFWAGVLFLLLSVFKFREKVIAAIPKSLKLAAASGIGFFIAFIGLQHAGLIVADGATLVRFGSISGLPVVVALLGLIATSIMLVVQVRGAILFGLLGTGGLALAVGLVPLEWKSHDLSLTATFLKLDLSATFTLAAIPAVATLLFFDLFDTVGTLMGVSEEAGLLDEEGRIPNAGRALFADAAGSVVGSLFGTATVTSYIESAAGVAAGARTGLSNMVVGALFLLALPLLPLAGVFGNSVPLRVGETTLFLYPVTAPALIVVGFLMTSALRKIDWDDYTESLPAFLTAILMPLSFSISAGLAAGLIGYVVLKLASGRHRELHPLMYAITGCIVAGYVAMQLTS